jgi:hypothetical protein
MITHLKSKNFMGHSIDEDIGQKTIYTGKNTVGKSTRANIIAITALGFSPFSSETNKRPADVLKDFCAGDKMVTEFTCCGVIFERKFTRSSHGKVSTIMRVNKTKASKSEFAVALSRAGDPRIIDLNAFLKLSDNGKVDTLFKLYPPGADLTNLDSNIEKSKKKISRFKESIGNNEGAIKKLIASKTDIEMPAGTLAETTAAIENLTKGVLDAKEALRIAEEKNANEQLLADAKIKLDEDFADKVSELNQEKPKSTQADFDQAMEGNTTPFLPEKPPEGAKTGKELDPGNMPISHPHDSPPSMTIKEDKYPHFMKIYDPENDPAVSIQKIIDTMAKTNCKMCAAGMLAKMELRKYKL